MRYKLINKTTYEDSFCDKTIMNPCEKITVNKFDYYVSDAPLVDGDPIMYKDGSEYIIGRYRDNHYGDCKFIKKLIATNNRIAEIPRVIDEIEKMADDFSPIKIVKVGFKEGYNKSQESNPYSKEDLIDFYMWMENKQWYNTSQNTPGEFVNPFGVQRSINQLLELWSDERIKIIYYQ